MLQPDENILQSLREMVTQSEVEPKFGSLIVRDGKIIASGFAHKAAKEATVADHPQLLIHAEEAALLEALRNRQDIRDADVYVLGVRADNTTRLSDLSYSCVTCSRLLLQSGAASVAYPIKDGWEKISVDEMFKKAIERVMAGRA